MALAKMDYWSLDFQFSEKKEGKKDGEKINKMKDTTILTCTEKS